jgi:hypothetical protein
VLPTLLKKILQTRVRRSYSLKAKLSENEGIYFLFEAKKVVFFALFACKRNTSKSENNESETNRIKRKSFAWCEKFDAKISEYLWKNGSEYLKRTSETHAKWISVRFFLLWSETGAPYARPGKKSAVQKKYFGLFLNFTRFFQNGTYYF